MTDIQKENKSGGKVPNLRFPEFEGEWKVKKLGEVATNFMYGMNAAATVYDGENQYIRITDIDERTRLFTPNPLSSPDGELEDKYLLEKGDILFARTGASVGKSYLYSEKDGKIFFAGFLIRLNVKTENPYFIFSQTLTEKYQKWVLTMSMRSGQPGINAEEYKLLSIVIPSIQEQEKISSFLSLIDERIQTQNKIINDLKTLKTATAKKIFLQELRLKDDNGNDFPEWEEDCLENVCDIKKGEQFNKEDLNEIGLYPCLNGGISPSGFSEKYNTDENTITISEGGNSCGFVNIMKTKFWLGGHCYKILLFKKISLMYFYQLLKFNEQNVMNLRVGSGLPNIQMKSLKRFTIKISTSESEHNKIANFLSAIDSKIDIESQLLQKLEEQKKFLLQNMFV